MWFWGAPAGIVDSWCSGSACASSAPFGSSCLVCLLLLVVLLDMLVRGPFPSHYLCIDGRFVHLPKKWLKQVLYRNVLEDTVRQGSPDRQRQGLAGELGHREPYRVLRRL